MKFIGNDASGGKYADPPTGVSATAGDAAATVTFTAAVYDGKGTATYLATSSPGGLTGSGSGSPITVSGLTNGTAYTFTVSTITGYGVSATSAASNSVTPVAPPYFPPYFPPSFPPAPCFAAACTPSCSAITSSTVNNGAGSCCSCPGGVAGQCRTTTTTYSGNTGSCTNACGEVTNCSGPPGPTTGCNFGLACY